jgi:hypothetical protein
MWPTERQGLVALGQLRRRFSKGGGLVSIHAAGSDRAWPFGGRRCARARALRRMALISALASGFTMFPASSADALTVTSQTGAPGSVYAPPRVVVCNPYPRWVGVNSPLAGIEIRPAPTGGRYQIVDFQPLLWRRTSTGGWSFQQAGIRQTETLWWDPLRAAWVLPDLQANYWTIDSPGRYGVTFQVDWYVDASQGAYASVKGRWLGTKTYYLNLQTEYLSWSPAQSYSGYCTIP